MAIEGMLKQEVDPELEVVAVVTFGPTAQSPKLPPTLPACQRSSQAF